MDSMLRREFRQCGLDREGERIIFFNNKKVTFRGRGRHNSCALRCSGAQVACPLCCGTMAVACATLFVAQRLDGVERGGTISGIKTETDADERTDDQTSNGPAVGENYIYPQPHR